MKRTLREFRISNRLDATGQPPSPAIEESELAPFADSMNVVDQRLRANRTPAPEPPPWLHASIMNEVQREAVIGQALSRPSVFRLVWAWGVVGVAVIVTVWALLIPMRPGDGPVLSASHAEVDEVVRAAAAEGAMALTEPFEVELENLSRDLGRTTEFLLASLP